MWLFRRCRVKRIFASLCVCVIFMTLTFHQGLQPLVKRAKVPQEVRVGSKKPLKLDDQDRGFTKGSDLPKKANASNLSLSNGRNGLALGDASQDNHLKRTDVRGTVQVTTPNGTQSKENNQACLIPELDPFDKSIRKYLRKLPPLKCEGIMRTGFKSKQLVLRKSSTPHSNYTFCYVSTIERVSYYESRTLPPIKIQVEQHQSDALGGDIPLGYNLTSDFTVVRCLDEKDNSTNQDFAELFHSNPPLFDVHARIYPEPGTLQRLRDTKPSVDGLGLNVVLIILESTSRMNFIRHLPKTRKVLEGLGAIILEGYNIVADATAGAIIPILNGKTVLELPDLTRFRRRSRYVDTYPFIWKNFSQNGYVTMFAEDAPEMPFFKRTFRGFDKQPTDHYMRNLWLVADERKHCLGPKPVYDVMLDYLLDYMTTYKTAPHFSLTMPCRLTHDNINPLQLMDPSLSGFLSNATSLGLLNNTMLVFFADHGSRYSSIRRSYQGKLEERLPFLSITLPPWVSKKHPDLVRNLRNNRKRLVTPFDVHETLQSVLHYNPKPGSVDQRGISLFNEIPRERTCEDAHIAPHWCTCLNWKPSDSEKKIQVAEALLAEINRNTEPVRDKCAKLSVGKILNTEKMEPDDQLLRFAKNGNRVESPVFTNSSTVRVSELATIYRVTLEAQPGGGLFEGTVKELPRKKKSKSLAYKSTGDISRINRYGSQADCISETFPTITQFCYCIKPSQ